MPSSSPASLRRFVASSLAPALALAAVSAAPGAGHIDMYYNPAPVVGVPETILISLPAGSTGTNVILYTKFSAPPCAEPLDCFEQFTPQALGQVTSFTYTAGPAQAQTPVSFFFVALGGQLAVSDMGVVNASAGNPLPPDTENPVLFVTQVPFSADFANVVAPFGSHRARPIDAPRGGDLFIRYPDGTLKNLTQLAGYGHSGLQGANSIAVRDPAVHWSGAKAIFSMVVGSPAQNAQTTYRWRLYEVTGLGEYDTPVITLVPGQPAGYNNVSPCYASDGKIIFTTDRPRGGEAHLYPQTDEYEATPTVTGLWKLDPATGALALLQHSPSGSFKPIVDSFGRIVFTRWDHLQRDLQKDEDIVSEWFGGNAPFQTFNYADESASAAILPNLEYFPEATHHFVYFVTNNPGYSGDMNGWVPNLIGNEFNRFAPWMINQDGTAEETLNHIGRHELMGVLEPAFNNGSGLIYHLLPNPQQANQNPIDNMMQIREVPQFPGTYVGVDAPEFFTHASGRLVKLTGHPSLNADQMTVGYLTQHATGHYRNPVVLTAGTFVSVHTADTANDDYQQPQSQYEFRMKTLKKVGAFWQPEATLTHGISRSVQWWTPFQLASYSGELWELDPVEVVARPPPPAPGSVLAAPEAAALAAAHVSKFALVQYLKANSLAVIVGRNVTTRDRNDRQQAFNLRVAGTTTQTIATSDPISTIKYLQLFQADQIRGMFKNNPVPVPGRRVIAVPLHDPAAIRPPLQGAPTGSVAIGTDGSFAALVPARRAMTWQLTDAQGTPVVRERYWLTFQPGEIRSCPSCHGANTADQAGNPPPANTPLALKNLLLYLKSIGELNGMPQIAPGADSVPP
jgi:hypothetical protein